MISWLKKVFIPHIHNNHRPYFLRNTNTRFIIYAVFFVEAFVFFLPQVMMLNVNLFDNMASVLPNALSELTNKERDEININELKVNETLNKAAQMKADDMAAHSYFAHTSPSGVTPWHWFESAGYKYQYAGENLAINFYESSDVTSAWMASPAHKANIVKKQYTEIGTGIAEGVYEGHPTIFVAQLYATPMKATKTVARTQNINKDADPVRLAPTAPSEVNLDILGAESDVQITNTENTQIAPNTEIQKVTLLQKAFTNPRSTTNVILILILSVSIIAFLLNALIKIEHHHPDLLTNGMAVVVIVFGIFIVNNIFYKNDTQISRSLDMIEIIQS